MAKTTMKYGIFIYVSISVNESSETSWITPSTLWPKNGRKRNIATLQSSSPKTKLRKCISFCVFSSSAIVSIASQESNSSKDTEKYFDIAFKESIFGYPLPDYHFEIAVRETYSISESSSCVSPFYFLSSCNFSLNSIIRLSFDKSINSSINISGCLSSWITLYHRFTQIERHKGKMDFSYKSLYFYCISSACCVF